MKTRYNKMFQLLAATTLGVLLLDGLAESDAANFNPPKAPADPCPAKQAPIKPAAAKPGDPAAPLEGLKYLKGQPVEFQAGKVYVIEFWATWCGPCVSNIPHLTKIQNKYRDQGVTVIGISIEQKVEKAKAFVAKLGKAMDYTVAVDVEHKAQARYMKAYKQGHIPCAFIVDQKGDVVWVGIPWLDMDKILAKVLGGTFDLAAYTQAQKEKQAVERKAKEIIDAYYKALKEGTSLKDARAIARRILKLNSPDALMHFAWYILAQEEEDNADNSHVDYELALEFAKQANADTGGQDPETLKSYATILANTSQFKEAVVVLKKAISLLDADDTRRRKQWQKRLDYLQKRVSK